MRELEAGLDALEAAGEALEARQAREVARVLGGVGARFADPADPLRREALEALPGASGLSAPMAEVVLDGMARDWTADRLATLLRAEFGDPGVLDGFANHVGESRTRAVGPCPLVQVVSGSVPGVGVNALIRALLVKAPTLIKPGRGDRTLPSLFLRGLAEVDAELARAAAVIYWPPEREELLDAALARAERVVVYGGDGTVEAIRRRTPVTTRLVAYHHRWSVAYVAVEVCRSPEELRRTAGAAARAVAVFDQRGCVSPLTVFVESSGTDGGRRFAVALADALEALEAELPSGSPSPEESARLQQLRGSAEILAAAGAPVWMRHGEGAGWTVIHDPRRHLEERGLTGRVVRVEEVEGDAGLAARLREDGAHLQTVGVAGIEGARREALARSLGRVGVCRVAPLEAVPFPPAWWHHDGGGPLRDLVRWVDLEAPAL